MEYRDIALFKNIKKEACSNSLKHSHAPNESQTSINYTENPRIS